LWELTLKWIGDNRVGDLASIAGVAISIIGFVITVIGVCRSKDAAEQAKVAAEAARDSVRLLDTLVDFSAAISILEEIKRAHRHGHWPVLPDRYAAIRKILIVLRSSTRDLSDKHQAVIQNAFANLLALKRRSNVLWQINLR
jgi:hypothetical protein